MWVRDPVRAITLKRQDFPVNLWCAGLESSSTNNYLDVANMTIALSRDVTKYNKTNDDASTGGSPNATC